MFACHSGKYRSWRVKAVFIIYCLFSFFFFQTILISAFLGKFTAGVLRKDSGKAIVYLMLLTSTRNVTLARIAAGFLEEAASSSDVYRRLHVWLETHPHILPPTGRFPTCFCWSAERISQARLMHTATEQSLFSFPYGILGGASQLGVHRHIPGGL